MTDSTTEGEKLRQLNEQIAAMEQQRDENAKAWLRDLLSRQFVFRRANGSVVDKPTFVKSLDEANQFASRQSGEISVTVLGERALVALIVRTTKADGTENRYRNIRLFSKQGQDWKLELWYNYDLTSL